MKEIELAKQEYNTLMYKFHKGEIDELSIQHFFMSLLERFFSEARITISYDSDELEPVTFDIYEDIDTLVSETDYNNQDEVNLMFDFLEYGSSKYYYRHPFIEKIISDIEYHADHYQRDDWFETGEYIEEYTHVYIQ